MLRQTRWTVPRVRRLGGLRRGRWWRAGGCGRSRRCFLGGISGQPGRLVASVDSHRHRLRRERSLLFVGSRRQPFASSQPRTLHIYGIAVQRAVDREQAQRTAGAFGLIDRARFQRHRDWIRFVRRGVPEFSGDQNRDGHQCRLAVRRQLEHGHRTRSRIFLSGDFPLPGRDLRPLFLRPRDDGPRRQACQQRDQEHCV